MIFNVNSIEELNAVAAEIIRRAESSDTARAVVCTLSGNLGAGKTTLTQALGKMLGITETMQSPTFVIRKRYETTHPVIKQLIHIDAYRLTSGDEIKKIRFEDDLALPYTLICLEWPEQIADLELVPDITVQLKHIDQTSREITVLP